MPILTPGRVGLFAVAGGAATGPYHVPTSIPADGSSDATAALQAFINSVPDGSTIQFASGGVYRTEGPLFIEDRADLTLDGNGATLQAFTNGSAYTPPASYFTFLWPRKRTRISVVGGVAVTVTNFVLRGGNPNAGTGSAAYVAALEAQHGVEFINVAGGSFTNSEVYDVYGDFVTVADSTDITVSGNYFRRNGRQGMSVSSGSGIWFTGNDQAEVRRAHFDIEADTDAGVIDDVHIVGNTTGASTLLWVANGGQSYHISNIYIEDNVMTHVTGVPLLAVYNNETGGKRGPYFVRRNRLLVGGSPSAALAFIGADGVTIEDNVATFDPTRDMTAVGMTDCTNVVIGGNTFTGAARDLTAD